MSLADLIAAQKLASRCSACQWYEQLTDTDRAAFDQAAIPGRISALHRACLKMDPPVPCELAHFTRHVRGECRR